MAGKEFDAALVEQARDGDRQAREQLMSRLEPLLRAYFIKRIGKKPVVDDLVQNTLLRVHKGLEDLNNPERLKAFSMKAALFEVQDLYRGRYSAKEHLYDPEQPPSRQMSEHPFGSGIDLERALSVLTPKARRIIELREYGYRYKEIARRIDSTEGAIKMQVKRAFDKMREALAVLLVLLVGGGLGP